MKRSVWVTQVERQLTRRWCITLSDMGFDKDDVTGFWASGEIPDAFVERITRKYDLMRFELLRP